MLPLLSAINWDLSLPGGSCFPFILLKGRRILSPTLPSGWELGINVSLALQGCSQATFHPLLEESFWLWRSHPIPMSSLSRVSLQLHLCVHEWLWQLLPIFLSKFCQLSIWVTPVSRVMTLLTHWLLWPLSLCQWFWPGPSFATLAFQ